MKLKTIFFFTSVFIFSFTFVKPAFGIYDPLSQKNNIFGIHILFPEEVSEASVLVNSNGGDWGYVTIPIKASDRNIEKWQKFMDDSKKYHLIPIVRLATDGDYFSKSSWSKPTDYDILDFANFLNSLSWPTQNRYVVVYNEPNRGDEWGGAPNAAEYSEILDYSTQVFKQKNPDFFIISAGFDNASVNISNQSVNQYTFMQEMEDAVPGIFSKIDGLGSHSYPNPGFSAAPSLSRNGIYSYYYQKDLAYQLSGKDLPVFITETGWSSDSVPSSTEVNYYNQAFNDYWNDKSIVAVTPFIFHAEQGPFAQFSFVENDTQSDIYKAYKNFSKVKGEPLLSKDFSPTQNANNSKLPLKKFEINNLNTEIFQKINKSTKNFFKWLLRL